MFLERFRSKTKFIRSLELRNVLSWRNSMGKHNSLPCYTCYGFPRIFEGQIKNPWDFLSMSFVNSFIVEITSQNLRHSQVKVFKNIWDETEIRTTSIARQVRISIQPSKVSEIFTFSLVHSWIPKLTGDPSKWKFR